jgi:hypothetical protein
MRSRRQNLKNDRISDKKSNLVLNVNSIGNMWDIFKQVTNADFKKYSEGFEEDCKTAFVGGAVSVVTEILKLGIAHLPPEQRRYIFESWRNESMDYMKQIERNNQLVKENKIKLAN